MALKMNFTIVESANGEYFTFTDTTGNYNVTTNPTGWGSPNYTKDLVTNPVRLLVSYDSTNYYYTFASLTELASIELTPSDIGLTGDTFEDGIYTFLLQISPAGAGYSSDYTYTYSEGFAAIITGSKIKEFLSYRPYLDYKSKDEILENMRLLNNLAYAASTGNTTAFSENLLILQQLD